MFNQVADYKINILIVSNYCCSYCIFQILWRKHRNFLSSQEDFSPYRFLALKVYRCTFSSVLLCNRFRCTLNFFARCARHLAYFSYLFCQSGVLIPAYELSNSLHIIPHEVRQLSVLARQVQFLSIALAPFRELIWHVLYKVGRLVSLVFFFRHFAKFLPLITFSVH